MSDQIQVPTRDQVDAKAQCIFDNLKQNLGMVPNLYATIGYSSDALENFLGFSGKAGASTFSKKELEAINLAVSEVNACQYCLAAHTAISKMNGFTEEETFGLRAGNIGDAKLQSISRLAADVARNRGKASDETKAEFFAQGYDEKGLIDLVSAVTAISFTNYVHNATEVPVDFPVAKPLSEVALAA